MQDISSMTVGVVKRNLTASCLSKEGLRQVVVTAKLGSTFNCIQSSTLKRTRSVLSGLGQFEFVL